MRGGPRGRAPFPSHEKKPKLEPKVGFVSTQEHDNNNFSKVD